MRLHRVALAIVRFRVRIDEEWRGSWGGCGWKQEQHRHIWPWLARRRRLGCGGGLGSSARPRRAARSPSLPVQKSARPDGDPTSATPQRGKEKHADRHPGHVDAMRNDFVSSHSLHLGPNAVDIALLVLQVHCYGTPCSRCEPIRNRHQTVSFDLPAEIVSIPQPSVRLPVSLHRSKDDPVSGTSQSLFALTGSNAPDLLFDTFQKRIKRPIGPRIPSKSEHMPCSDHQSRTVMQPRAWKTCRAAVSASAVKQRRRGWPCAALPQRRLLRLLAASLPVKSCQANNSGQAIPVRQAHRANGVDQIAARFLRLFECGQGSFGRSLGWIGARAPLIENRGRCASGLKGFAAQI